MSSLFNHVFIPIVILLIFYNRLGIDPKKIVFLSFFGALPDADIILVHRASLHNIFILVIPVLAFIFINREIFGIMSFYLISHIILDIFNGGVYLLHPFYENVFFARTEILFGNGINYMLDYGINNNIINIAKLGEAIISSENIAVIILLIIIMSVIIIKNKIVDRLVTF